MSKRVTVTVTFEGPQGSGKTKIADVLRDALMNEGAVCVGDNESHWRTRGFDIQLIEKQVA